MIPTTTFLAVAIFSLATSLSARETHTKIFYPDHPVSGQTSIEIILDTEGDISWYSDSASDVAITVTLTVDTESRFNDTEAHFNTTMIEFTDDPGSNTVSLGIQNCTERADVAIFVPRNFTFTAVTLSSRRGSNQIDHTLNATNAVLTCSSGANNTVCGSCCHGNGRCVDGGCQCKSGFQADDNCETQWNSSYSINTNPANPVIMTIETVESEQLQVLGDKDEDGVASGVQSLTFEDGEGNTTFVTLNANNSLMDTITMLSGTYLHFDWNENLTDVYVTAVSPSGSTQVNINVDLSDIDTNNRSKRDIDIQSSDSNYLSEIPKTSNAKSQSEISKSSLTKRQSGGIAKVPVTVTHCGEPEPNAQVFAKALLNYKNTPSGHRWAGEAKYMAVHTTSSGVYHVKIPTPSSSVLGTIADVCELTVKFLGLVCKRISRTRPANDRSICFAIAFAVGLSHPPLSVPAFRTCILGFRAFRLYCKNLDTSRIPGTPSPAELICDSISTAGELIDLSRFKTIHLQPYAIFPAGNRVTAVGQTLLIQPGASGVLRHSFNIEDTNTLPVLKLLTVNPNDPAPRESYSVSVSYICATPSVTVTMHIIGTDSYEKSATCYGNSPSSCVLYVPGAEALVKDRITITITEPSKGYSFTRQVVVVF